MFGKIMVCEETKIALLLVHKGGIHGVTGAYNQILLNALICAFMTIFDNYHIVIRDCKIDYHGTFEDGEYIDFANSDLLKKYINDNPDVWFCKIIKEKMQ